MSILDDIFQSYKEFKKSEEILELAKKDCEFKFDKLTNEREEFHKIIGIGVKYKKYTKINSINRICANCYYEEWPDGWRKRRCTYPNITKIEKYNDIVNGHGQGIVYKYCEDVRNNEKLCGRYGKLFYPKTLWQKTKRKIDNALDVCAD